MENKPDSIPSVGPISRMAANGDIIFSSQVLPQCGACTRGQAFDGNCEPDKDGRCPLGKGSEIFAQSEEERWRNPA